MSKHRTIQDTLLCIWQTIWSGQAYLLMVRTIMCVLVGWLLICGQSGFDLCGVINTHCSATTQGE